MSLPEKENGKTRASLELLYGVSREFAAALDLVTVLQRVLFLSMQTVGAMSGSIIVLDDSGKPIESAVISSGQLRSDTTQRLRITLEKGLAGWVMQKKEAVLIEDTRLDKRWMELEYETKGEPTTLSATSAPLLVRDRLVGLITLGHPRPGFFTADHLELIQAIADQAGVAVLNARLYQESQRQARVMTALAESAAAITGSLNLNDVLLRILDQISQALRVQAVSLALIDPAQGDLVFRAVTGWSQPQPTNARLHLGQGIAGWVAREGQGVIASDAQLDPRYDPEINRRIGRAVFAIACAPIRSGRQVIGVLEAVNPVEGRFDPGALMVLTGIGSLAGTAIRHAQLFEQLQAAHQRYLELFEDSINPILITDWNGMILEANRQAANAVSCATDQLIGQPIESLRLLNEEKVGPRFAHLSGGETVSYDTELRCGEKEPLPVQVYVRQVEIDGAKQLQWILQDMTERKKLDELREDLLSMIYHDLQSPLANVVSSLELASGMLTGSEDPAFDSLIRIATRSTERVQRLVSSMLDINRLESGRPMLNRQPAVLGQIAQEALEIVTPIIQSKHQVLTNKLPANLPAVLVDIDMIRRVLTNLLENSVKYTPNRGRILLGGKRVNTQVYLWVEDNGPGIPPEEQEHIFEKFARLKYRDAPKGLGIGLAYCRLAVEAHGGRIWVEPSPEGGARFIFTLPVAGESGPAAKAFENG